MPATPLTPFALDRMLGDIAGDRARLAQIRASAEGRVPYLTVAGIVAFAEAMKMVSVGAAMSPTALRGPGDHMGMLLPSDGHAWIGFTPGGGPRRGGQAVIAGEPKET